MGTISCQAINNGNGATTAPLPSNSPPSTTASPPPPPPQVIYSPRPSNAANEVVCGSPQTISGLDVSDYDPKVDWRTVQKSGRSFSFVKATEGTTFKNPNFSTDWPAIKAAGMIRGAYHYFHPNIDPLKQAGFFLSTVGTLGSSDLPPVLDWEVSDKVSVASDIQSALVWLEQVEAVTGKTPIIYVDPSFWNSLGNPAEFMRFPLFIANYDVSCPEIPPPWSSWTFWQQGSGPIDGVPANAVSTDIFNGSSDQLNTLVN